MGLRVAHIGLISGIVPANDRGLAMARACVGVKVLEISRGMAGSLAGMILADHGADVIRAEDPAGDRHLSQAGERTWSRGKRRIALDMDSEADRARAFALAEHADVVLCGIRPTVAERWGLTYERLATANPRVIFASISGFGWTGPNRDQQISEGMVQALSGSMAMPANGSHRPGPAFLAPPLGSYAAALTCVQGIIAALRERDASGHGQHVDASLYHGLLVNRSFLLWEPEQHAEDFPVMRAVTPDHRGIRPLFNLNECADGRWLSMGGWTPALAYKTFEIMGLSHLLADERYAGMPNFFADEAHRLELLNILWAEFKTKPLQHWLDLMDEHGIPSEPAQSVDEFRHLGQLWANGLAIEVDDPVLGKMVQQGPMGDFSETPGEVQAAEPAARRAEESAGLLESWRTASPAPSSTTTLPANARGPLAGVRVLDFTAFLSGPMCAHLLSDMGATVIKVEPETGDDFRMSAPTVFRGLHRDKRSVVIDLKRPGGEEVLERLVRETDVVVSNYRLGVEDRLGLSYERLKAINPNLVVCRMTAFGGRGERAHRGGYDASITALSGLSEMQAGAGNPPVSITIADISTGLVAATTIMLGIRARETQGIGQHIDVCMIGATAYVGADAFVGYEGKPALPALDQGQHGLGPCHRLYQTSDGWVFVSALAAPAIQSFQRLLGEASVVDQPAVERTFASRTTADWLSALGAASIPAADALVDAKRNLHDTPEFRANGTRIDVLTERYGNLGQAGPAVRFSRTPARIERQEPPLGADTVDVLHELGFDDAFLDHLRATGAMPGSRVAATA